MTTELDRHHKKLVSLSKLAESDILFLEKMVLSKVNFVDLEVISEESWMKAFQLVKQIDEYDAPFVSLSLNLNTFLWSGDKKLRTGLKRIGYNRIVDSDWLLNARDSF